LDRKTFPNGGEILTLTGDEMHRIARRNRGTVIHVIPFGTSRAGRDNWRQKTGRDNWRQKTRPPELRSEPILQYPPLQPLRGGPEETDSIATKNTKRHKTEEKGRK
jgi:hypothetical protein